MVIELQKEKEKRKRRLYEMLFLDIFFIILSYLCNRSTYHVCFDGDVSDPQSCTAYLVVNIVEVEQAKF